MAERTPGCGGKSGSSGIDVSTVAERTDIQRQVRDRRFGRGRARILAAADLVAFVLAYTLTYLAAQAVAAPAVVGPSGLVVSFAASALLMWFAVFAAYGLYERDSSGSRSRASTRSAACSTHCWPVRSCFSSPVRPSRGSPARGSTPRSRPSCSSRSRCRWFRCCEVPCVRGRFRTSCGHAEPSSSAAETRPRPSSASSAHTPSTASRWSASATTSRQERAGCSATALGSRRRSNATTSTGSSSPKTRTWSATSTFSPSSAGFPARTSR